MMLLLGLLAGGLYLGHRQSQKRAEADAAGAKAPDNALAPTNALIADDNTGLPTPTRNVPAEASPLASVPMSVAEASPSVALAPQTFAGDEVKLFFETASKEDRWTDPDAEEERRRQEKAASREEFKRQS